MIINAIDGNKAKHLRSAMVFIIFTWLELLNMCCCMERRCRVNTTGMSTGGCYGSNSFRLCPKAFPLIFNGGMMFVPVVRNNMLRLMPVPLKLIVVELPKAS